MIGQTGGNPGQPFYGPSNPMPSQHPAQTETAPGKGSPPERSETANRHVGPD